MTSTQAVTPRPVFWKTILKYGAIHFMVMTFGAFVLEVLQDYSGGCMFVVPAYFMVIPVVLSILTLQRFGAGIGVFLPYTVLGFFPTYYFEWFLSPNLVSIWGVVGWCLLGPIVGLTADLVFGFLPKTMPEKWRAVVLGVTIGVALFITTYLGLATFYRVPSMASHFRFFNSPYLFFSLPWLILNGGFAGYTAYAITKRV